MEIIEYIINLEFTELVKFIVAFLGFVALIIRITESFSSIRRKQNLKIDLEIFNQAKSNNKLNTDLIEENIKNRISSTYQDNGTSKFTNFFLGIIVFIGFGWWSIDIIEINEKFNPWVMLTIFTSVIGLSMIFDDGKKSTSKKPFFSIEFSDKTNFKTGCLFSIATLISIGVLITYEIINGWLILPIVFFFVFIFSVINNIKFRNLENKEEVPNE